MHLITGSLICMKIDIQEEIKVTHEEIARYAYLLWEEDGCPEGRDIDYWVKAETLLYQGASAEKEKAPVATAAAKPRVSKATTRSKAKSTPAETTVVETAPVKKAPAKKTKSKATTTKKAVAKKTTAKAAAKTTKEKPVRKSRARKSPSA